MFIYHISNCGLLIELAGKRILIDAIFCDNNSFNPMRHDVETDIFEGKEPFDRIDCMLFTHCHNDHFDKDKVIEYQNRHPEVVITVTEDLKVSEGVIVMKGDQGTLSVGALMVTYHKTPHMFTGKDDNVDHVSFVIEGEGKRIFISGDMELTEKMADAIKAYGRYDIGILNPIMIANKKWLERLVMIDIEKKYVYHIPLEENDVFGYRRIAIGAVKRHVETLANCIPLLGELETVM